MKKALFPFYVLFLALAAAADLGLSLMKKLLPFKRKAT
jgi:hypothetical protein